MFRENIKIMATVNEKNGKKNLDYYVVKPDGSKEYLVTRPYIRKCYDMCKSGIRYNDLMKIRSRNKGEMLLVECMKRMNDYIRYEYDAA